MSKRRVVITGLGIVSPVGNDVNTAWDNIINGRSGIGLVTRFDASAFPSRVVGEVKNFDVTEYMSAKEARHLDTFIHYGIAAAVQAVKDAGLENAKTELKSEDLERIGVNIGSGIGGLPMIENTHTTYIEKGLRRISPFFIPSTIANMVSGNVSIMYGFQGPNLAICTACTTATHCIGDSARMIEYGDADIMIAGGAESTIVPLALGGFGAARALTTQNDNPEGACCPWDQNRDGFILAEGAGVLVLEEYEHAKARGAKIYAELAGFGMSADAHHITAPTEDGSGAGRCMKNALKNAGIDISEVNYLNAHGTSTPLGDYAETLAAKLTFGDHVKNIMMSSTKSMTGHLLGAAGGVEAIFTALAVKNQIAPPTINLNNPDPKCDLDYVPNQARKAEINVALSNSFGFGGTNGTIIFKKI